MGYKISIGSNIIRGPWGGGNQFALSLLRYLEKKGWEVTTNLLDRSIDLIIMTEPRITSKSGVYNQRHIARYLIRKPDTVVVHRVNECDERKGTKGVNKYLMRANRIADYTIFISEFLRNLFIKNGLFKSKDSAVVKNGADAEIFNRKNLKKWDGKSTLKIVTHHWAYNYNKGFDIYEKLSNINSIENINIRFSYIGALPGNIKFRGMKMVPTLYGEEIAKELRSNHIYVTASINEPAGMHHIEGAMCGLPLLYRNSGALPEYCQGFGIMFEGIEDFTDKLKELIKKYRYYFDKLEKYPNNSGIMCQRYENIFLKLLGSSHKLDKNKRRFRYLIIFLKETFFYIRDLAFIKFKRLIEKVFKKLES